MLLQSYYLPPFQTDGALRLKTVDFLIPANSADTFLLPFCGGPSALKVICGFIHTVNHFLPLSSSPVSLWSLICHTLNE